MKPVLRMSLVVVACVLLNDVAPADEKAAAVKGVASPAKTTTSTGAVAAAPIARASDEPVIPQIQLNEVTLQVVLDFLQEAAPGSQMVVVYEPGAEQSQPIITNLKLTHVTPGQVLQALGRVFPQLDVSASDEGGSIIYTVRVRNKQTRETVRVTRVFRMREAIDQVAREAADTDGAAPRGGRPQARNAVLALLDTALQAGGNPTPPQLQFHEPTETLVFRGTAEEASLVDEALAALRPRMTRAVARMLDQVNPGTPPPAPNPVTRSAAPPSAPQSAQAAPANPPMTPSENTSTEP